MIVSKVLKKILLTVGKKKSILLKKNQRNLLVTSNSNYYTVLDGDGNKYADCGWEKDAQRICELHEGEGFTYRHASELQQPEL